MNLLSDEVQEALAPYELEDSRVREPLCAWESLGSSKKKDPTKENDRENDRSKKDNRDNEELLSLVVCKVHGIQITTNAVRCRTSTLKK
jgi:hypothetical protein